MKSEPADRAMVGGVWVPMEAYEYFKHEVDKLAKERDEAQGKAYVFRYLFFGLLGLLLLSLFFIYSGK
jgi:hypothetical protein